MLKIIFHMKLNAKIGINFKTYIFMRFRIIQFTFLWVIYIQTVNIFYISSGKKKKKCIYICLNI